MSQKTSPESQLKLSLKMERRVLLDDYSTLQKVTYLNFCRRYLDSSLQCLFGKANTFSRRRQTHPEFGLAILNERNSLENIKACGFEHHESFLGNGYPQQLQSHEIHAMARVVAVADTYDALTTKLFNREAPDLNLSQSQGRSLSPVHKIYGFCVSEMLSIRSI